MKTSLKLAYACEEQARVITIPPKDWNAITLAAYLQEQMRLFPESASMTVTFDRTEIKFLFSMPIYIMEATTCWKELGLIVGKLGAITKSDLMINLIATTCITVDSNLSVHNQPPSSILNKIPLPTSLHYGQTLDYVNSSTDFSNFSSDFAIPSIRIRLLDDKGELLVDSGNHELYEYDEIPPWEIVIFIEPETQQEIL